MHHSQKQYKALYFIAALIAAAVSVFLIELGGVGDSDYYWHIVLGREICSTHTIPVTDTFSWLSQDLGLTETAHSWLSSPAAKVIILYYAIRKIPQLFQSISLRQSPQKCSVYMAVCAIVTSEKIPRHSSLTLSLKLLPQHGFWNIPHRNAR